VIFNNILNKFLRLDYYYKNKVVALTKFTNCEIYLWKIQRINYWDYYGI